MRTYKVFNVDERGYSHVVNNLPKQDHSYSEVCDDYALAIISDGHGSPQYFRSDHGSELAIEAAVDILKEFIAHATNVESLKNQLLLKKKIKEKWDFLVIDDYIKHPFTEEELDTLEKNISKEIDSRAKQKMLDYLSYYRLGQNVRKAYGCTLIAIACFRGYTLGVHIGDGTCTAFYPDGSCDQPIPNDPHNMANTTGSLSNDNTGCRVHFFAREPMAVFVASDGIDDSFGVGEMLYNFYRGICINFAENGESYKDTLQSSLAAISEKGSKDDMSISGIYDLKELIRFKEIMKKMHECGKLRIRLNYLTDTSGGVSDYSLEAARKSWDRAQTEQLHSEQELNRLKHELKMIHDALLSMQMEAIRKGTHYHDPHKIADELQHYHKKEQSLRYELQKTSDTIHSLEVKAKRYQDQNHQEKICVQNEATLIEKVRQLEEDVRIKEQRYYELKAKRQQADEEMHQLIEQISVQEIEIQDMIHSLSSEVSPNQTPSEKHSDTPTEETESISENHTNSLERKNSI